MPTQLSMFDTDQHGNAVKVEAKKLARRTDPVTSKEAAKKVAESAKIVTQRSRIENAMHAHPGCTYRELAERMAGVWEKSAEWWADKIHKRGPEIARDRSSGIVRVRERKCEVTGEDCLVYDTEE